jgi:hypothetical protein
MTKMFGKEQIIEEMKRIAVTTGGNLNEKTFEQYSTIPLSTVRFHLGSWQRALKEAGLTGAKQIPDLAPKSEDELLLELIRLNKVSGELPTRALIEAKGKFKFQYYLERWKSIAEAFERAKDKFTEKFRTPTKIESIPTIKPMEHEQPKKQQEPMSFPEKKIEKKIPEPLASEDIDLEGEDVMNHNHPGIKTEKIKFIPQTIKPQKAIIKPRISAEPIDFRGLRFAPANRQGVIFLFGIICHELGFLIESFISEFPDCEGKRCVDQENNQWEPIKIQFEYKSSDFKTRTSTKGYDQSLCDLIVCWNHNWDESSIEVLELRSVLQYLE